MRINLFTLGDCTDINTWSNLPYFLYNGLRERSIDVRPIDLIPSEARGYGAFRRLRALQDKVARSVGIGCTDDELRTAPFHALVNRRLSVIARRHADADVNLFLTFSFSSYRFAGVPVVHYCDRTYEHHLEETGQRPRWRDRRYVQIDRRNIENADLVLSTNKPCCDFIQRRYKTRRVRWLTPGINADRVAVDPDRLIDGKAASTDVLFIGRGAHSRGADVLVRAFTLFNQRHDRRYTLHIVGVKQEELPGELQHDDPCIRFHGYLDRNIVADQERYNDLIRSARMFVMPMRPGPYPGVIREMLLNCTPVILSNAAGLSDLLTHERTAILVDSLAPADYACQMDHLVRDTARWRELAANGHTAFRHRTWSDTVNQLLDVIAESNLSGRTR